MAPPPFNVKTVGKTWAKKMNALADADVTRMSNITTKTKSRVRGNLGDCQQMNLVGPDLTLHIHAR